MGEKLTTRLMLFLATMLILPASTCGSGKDLRLEAFCDATAQDSDNSAEAILLEGTDNVVLAATPLIAKRDKACPN